MLFKCSGLLLSVMMMQIISAFSQTNLKQEMQQALDAEKLAGAAWCIVDTNGITTDAAGFKKMRTGSLLQPTDRVQVGSITKSLLTLGIFKLISEGRIQLYDSVAKYLPQLHFNNPWSLSRVVRIRHLLDHTSGLEDLRFWQVFTLKATPEEPLINGFSKNSLLRLRTEPGSVFSYSNMGFTLLAMIIEAVVKEPYEKYLNQHLLHPLGMRHSTFGFVTQTGVDADSTLAMGHLDNGEEVAAIPYYLRPAGQFTTTPHDMGVFLKFLMSNGTLNGTPFIDSTLLQAMGKPLNTIAQKNGLEAGYGLGAYYKDLYGYKGLVHPGSTVGYHAMYYVFPDQQKAFFISHNMDKEGANYERFNKILLNRLNITPQKPAETLPVTESLVRWEGYYLPVVSKYQPLALLDVISNFSSVAIEGNTATLKTFQKRTKVLAHTGSNRFAAAGKTEASHVFYISEGRPQISDGFITYRKVRLSYLVIYWLSFIFGTAGLGWLLLSGVVRLIRSKKAFVRKPVWAAFLSIIMLLAPVPFFFMQPFLALGDITVASMLLAVVTGILPVALIISLYRYWKSGVQFWYHRIDMIALLLLLQLVTVLAIWGMIPFRLWV